MESFLSKMQIFLTAIIFWTSFLATISAANTRFRRKQTLTPASIPKMKWPDGMMSIEDFNASFDSLRDRDDEVQENFLLAFEELSPEVQESILYFYDENLRLTAENIKLSHIVDYLLDVFPIKVEVYVQDEQPMQQQQQLAYNPYGMYNFYNPFQQYPAMAPGPSSYYAQNPYGFGYPSPSVQFIMPMGLGMEERDKRFTSMPIKYRSQNPLENRGRSMEDDESTDDEIQLSEDEIILLFLLQQCVTYYEETDVILPECKILVTQLFGLVDKEKLEGSLRRINLHRSIFLDY